MRPSARFPLPVSLLFCAFVLLPIPQISLAFPQDAAAKKDPAAASPATTAGDASTAKITSLDPPTFAPGHSITLKVRGTGLASLQGRTLVLSLGSTSLQVKLDTCKDETDKSTALCGNLNIPPGIPTGAYSISLAASEAELTKSNLTTAATFDVSAAGLEKDYVLCPTVPGTVQTSAPNPNPGSASGGTLDQITCSQSLLSRNEAADIFGKRVANTYLVVQVDVRNLSDDFQFLLHDVRLTYDAQAVAGREKRLVRGVSEKGQALDVRNLAVRTIQGSGSVLGGISVLSFASTAFKDAANIYQGPFAGAIQNIFPDFTIGQLNRLNDMAFGVQTIVIPKRSSVAFVSFLPQQVFLDDNDRKLLKTPWYSVSQPKGKMLKIQQNLAVEIAGAHVEEVQKTTPTLTALVPSEVTAQDTKVSFTLIGTNLDKVASLRISQVAPASADSTVKQVSPSKDLRITLPTHDPKLATTDQTDISAILTALTSAAQKDAASANASAAASVDYPVFLETILGEAIPTTLKLTIKGATPAPAAPAKPGNPAVTAATTTDSSKSAFVTIPASGANPLATEIAFTGTNLDQIKSFTSPNLTTCPATDVDQEVSLDIPSPTTDPKSLTVKMTLTSKTQAKAAGKVNVCATLKDGTTTLELSIPNFAIKALAASSTQNPPKPNPKKPKS
jgi:hypothetical protein